MDLGTKVCKSWTINFLVFILCLQASSCWLVLLSWRWRKEGSSTTWTGAILSLCEAHIGVRKGMGVIRVSSCPLLYFNRSNFTLSGPLTRFLRSSLRVRVEDGEGVDANPKLLMWVICYWALVRSLGLDMSMFGNITYRLGQAKFKVAFALLFLGLGSLIKNNESKGFSFTS